jgi:hypothetical protein
MILAGEAEAVELVLIILKLHGALSVWVGDGLREVSGLITDVLRNVIGLLARKSH